MSAVAPPRSGTVAGAQSIRRGIAVLQAVAEGRSEGLRLVDIAKACDLHVATTHRMLGALIEEGFLIYAADRKTYLLGPEILRLGNRAQGQQILVERFRGNLKEIAELTEDTVFLSIPSGFDAICLARSEGRYPIRTMSLEIGSVRPLGVGAGSLALCAFLSDDECEAAIRRNAPRFDAFGVDETLIREMAERARVLGYALNDGRVLDNVTGVGVPIRDDVGQIIAAISVAAISARMPRARTEEIAAIIRGTLSPSEGAVPRKNVPAPRTMRGKT